MKDSRLKQETSHYFRHLLPEQNSLFTQHMPGFRRHLLRSLALEHLSPLGTEPIHLVVPATQLAKASGFIWALGLIHISLEAAEKPVEAVIKDIPKQPTKSNFFTTTNP